MSHKQRRFSFSSFYDENIAAVNADYLGYGIKMSFLSMFPHQPLRHELLVDSKAIFETLTTLHTSEDFRLRATSTRMRASSESRDVNAVRWIPGVRNLADAMTERNGKMSKQLNTMLVDGIWHVYLEGTSVLNSKSWVWFNFASLEVDFTLLGGLWETQDFSCLVLTRRHVIIFRLRCRHIVRKGQPWKSGVLEYKCLHNE